ncbi:MAG: hypothetical protein V5A84_01520 [Planctomycetota bacterium]
MREWLGKIVRSVRRVGAWVILALVLAVIVVWGVVVGKAVYTIHDLFTENRELKEAVTKLTEEEQIGYAKVLEKKRVDGELHTTIKFVETARGNKRKHVLEKTYTVRGETVHFDALIVKFGDQMVMDGRQRALFLWRRVYGEHRSPSAGFPIETPGEEPKRYEELLSELPVEKREMFWDAVWELANDPDKLARYDIQAVYGNVVYSRLQEGLIYVFKIDNSGQLYPEVVPDI